MSEYNQGFDLKEMIDNLPTGLDRAILRTLSFHIGRENALSRGGLMVDLSMVGFDFKDDRPVRAAINQLRKAGHPICSTGGTNGGYWIAEDWQELNEYLDREVRSRMKDLRETELSLKDAGEKRWGKYSPARQASLF